MDLDEKAPHFKLIKLFCNYMVLYCLRVHEVLYGNDCFQRLPLIDEMAFSLWYLSLIFGTLESLQSSFEQKVELLRMVFS